MTIIDDLTNALHYLLRARSDALFEYEEDALVTEQIQEAIRAVEAARVAVAEVGKGGHDD